jgi:two-component system osmolarity sensor histidine kinase EnvZ
MTRSSSLFRRTALTLSIAFVFLMCIVFGAIAYFINLPLGRQATDDLAALIVLSAQTWVELPPSTRHDFERELIEHHGLIVQPADTPLPNHTTILPYRLLLEQALEKRLGYAVPVLTTHNPEYYWVDIDLPGHKLRVGFSHDRIGTQQPFALAIIFAAMLVTVVITSLILARRMTGPLTRLSKAAQAVGHGSEPTPLPETGPAELAMLARSFNHMAHDVRELLANRTTLLAGVSHDLRTPLARLRIAAEMLPKDSDPKLLAGIVRDLDVMDNLLAQYLALARGMIEETIESLDLRELVDGVVADARRAGATVQWTPAAAPVICAVRPHALERIVTNLLDNARRYGEGKAIDIECEKTQSAVVIRVLDRGPGIPEAEREAVFRPFHRLEVARSSAGGGSGLGLAIAQQLAEANGWAIALATRPGGGMIVSLRLACEPQHKA